MRTARIQTVAWLVWGCAACATTAPVVDELPTLACHNLPECQASCQNGSHNACRALGVLLANAAQTVSGKSAPAVEEAWRSGCAIGDLDACSQLGDHLLDSPIAGARRGAVSPFSKACTGGHARACLQLGAMYARGEASGAKDEGKALSLYEQACTLGHPVACNRLGMMYELGRVVARDPQRAQAYYDAGCARASAEACTNAATLLIAAHPSNAGDTLRAARALLRKGCSAGDQRACELLADDSI